MAMRLSRMHYILLKEILEKGYVPSINDLSGILKQSEEDVIKCLKDLEEYHGVVLHPKSSEVWIIHPFSLSPTNFWVESSRGKWWGNCAWCSLGIAAIIKEDVIITVTLGGESEQIQIPIKDGKIMTKENLFVHFPIPMRKAWDNVVYTCSVMQIFSSEENVDKWCERHRIPQGDLQPLENIWQFAQVWYGNHLAKDWTKWTCEQAKEIFHKFHLTNDIWMIPQSNERF